MNDAIDPQPQPTEPSGRGSPGWSTPSDTSRNARVEAIFALALESASGERLDFISAACGDDIELRERVLRLLAAHDSAGTVFEEFGDAELELEFARLKPEAAGDRIGPYLLIEQIGEGGFGVVWKAEQDRPMKRKVALKIIKLGMDTRNVIARFEQERQALAFMSHPNIAKVLDAGATQHGRPYFVMELVLGAKITDYCDEIGVDIPGRLKLFMEVCRAVQHAHQKGIIHRDLKPSNVLIALQDGRPVPKVIDFGVAKAIQQRLTELTIFTEVEQLIGTPLYMSP
jgi:non-specific serine/threonine protein kinase/serine/threonine-protein kinase